MRRLLLLLFLFTAVQAFGFTTVVIDAGHGGHDRGGVPGQRIGEKNLTLDVAQRLRAILREHGLRTVMTRSTDVFVTLPGRVAMGNRQGSKAVFVSVHFNSAKREGANGIETYYYSRSSSRLAHRIHAQVRRAAGTEDRGVRRRGYYVLRKSRIPAVLVECGFLTNHTEGRRCLSAAHRQRLAAAIARGILAAR